MKLHYSQTAIRLRLHHSCFTTLWNYTTLKLRSPCIALFASFTTLWNYTTLKRADIDLRIRSSFTTLWNYTTLKLVITDWNNYCGFTTLWNYTTLKRTAIAFKDELGFTTLWNYTTLKHSTYFAHWYFVLLPYEITLLSNMVTVEFRIVWFYYLMKLHYSQTA